MATFLDEAMRNSLLAFLTLVLLGAPQALAQEAAPLLAIDVQARADARGLDEIAEMVERVVSNDLLRSGRVTPAAAPANALRGVNEAPDFAMLTETGARYAVVAEVSRETDGRVTIAFRAFDVSSQRQVGGLFFRSMADNARRLAHRIADAIAPSLGGSAEFDSRLVAVAGEGPAARVVIMDSDGANPFVLARAGDHTEAQFARAFVIYTQGRRLIAFDLLTARTQMLTPEGDIVPEAGVATTRGEGYIAYARAGEDGAVDLQVEDLRDRRALRVLRLPGWQGEPTFSSDGQRLAFLSDEGGARRIMIATREGGDAAALGPAGQYKHLAWSPDGAHLAFVRRNEGRDELGLMRVDGAGEPRVLASAATFGRPSWSPGGAMVLVPEEGAAALIDASSGRRTPLALGLRDLRALSWSGLIP